MRTRRGIVNQGDVHEDAPGEELRALAGAHGVATEFWDYRGTRRQVSTQTICAVLTAMGVPCSTDAEIQAALREHDLAPWRRILPPSVVLTAGAPTTINVHVPDGSGVQVFIDLEDGGQRRLAQVDNWTAPREVDGQLVGRASFAVPADLPLGWHGLRAEV